MKLRREIVFKAKRLDSEEWIEGFLTQGFSKENHNELGYYISFLNDDNFETHQIDPDTVCQYTGFNDKYDKKIFESDVTHFAEYVAFENGCWKFIYESLTEPRMSALVADFNQMRAIVKNTKDEKNLSAKI